MKKIKINGIINKKSLFLLNNDDSNNTKISFSYLNNNIDILKKNKSKKTYFRNNNFLKNSKLQSYLYKLRRESYVKTFKIKKQSNSNHIKNANS